MGGHRSEQSVVAEEEAQEVKCVLARQRQGKWDGFLRGASRDHSGSCPSVMTENQGFSVCHVLIWPGSFQGHDTQCNQPLHI